jgi:hypothetical protein
MVLSAFSSIVLQQTTAIALLLVWLAAVIIIIAGVWKTFTKANQPGWAALIPIYNFYVMLKIGNNEWWWLLVLLVPLVNLYAMYKIFAGVSRGFGNGVGFALGLWFLGFIFFPLLGFGNYTYQGKPA